MAGSMQWQCSSLVLYTASYISLTSDVISYQRNFYENTACNYSHIVAALTLFAAFKLYAIISQLLHMGLKTLSMNTDYHPAGYWVSPSK